MYNNTLYFKSQPWPTILGFELLTNYSATSNNTNLVHWPLMGGLLHLVQREGAWAGCGPVQSLLAVPNVTAHTHQRPVYQSLYCLLYDGPLLCGFSVAIKGLSPHQHEIQARALRNGNVFLFACLLVCLFVCPSNLRGGPGAYRVDHRSLFWSKNEAWV